MTLPPVARIDEPRCIGCARCLTVCPTDAIVGAEGFLHAVIAADCTGCEKCLPVCPTDCILIEPRPATTESRSQLGTRWRALIQRRKARLAAKAREATAARERTRAALREKP